LSISAESFTDEEQELLMANFSIAISITLDPDHEGGYNNDPDDSGGETNFGITQADMPGVSIKDLTIDRATAYYLDHYWKVLYSQIESQAVANKLFDMGVLAGVGTAVRMLQIAMGITVDGNFGPFTLMHLNQVGDSILPAYMTRMEKHYADVAAKNPKDAKFLKGWERRVEL
jgi:lysozyme family protein